MHLILNPVDSQALEAVEITGSLFAVGRYEPPFSTYERTRVAKLSKRHARIFEQDGQIYIADLGSTNGTRLNGERLDKEPAVIGAGDKVSFGGLDYEIEVVAAVDEPDRRAELRLVLTPERDQEVLEPIAVMQFPFLVNKYSDAFSRYKDVLPDQLAFMSRRHAHFFVRDGALYIEDLDSTNGTFVGGEKLDEHARELRDGDLVAFGGDHFVYRVHILTESAGSEDPDTSSVEHVADPNRTIFIDSPTSFVEIYVGSQEANAVEERDGAAQADERETRAVRTEPTKVGRAFSFMGQLKRALLGDAGLSRRTRWSYRLVILAALAGGGYYYWNGAEQRAVERELADGDFLEAATRANRYLEAHPQAEQWREFATEALLKHLTPEWTTHVELKEFDTADRLLAGGAEIGRANPDDDGLLALLDWATRLARFLDQRTDASNLNDMITEGGTVRELLDWWESDTRTHARELLRLSGIVTEFAPIRERIYSDVRQLQAINRELRPIQAFRQRLGKALDARDMKQVRQALEEFGEIDPRFRQSPPLEQDAERMAEVFRALGAGHWLAAYRELTETPFQTLPFREHAERMIGKDVPDADTAARYFAAQDAWRAGDADAALGALDALAAEPWGSEANAMGKSYRALLDGLDALIATRTQPGYEERLFRFYGRLDSREDRALIDRLGEDFAASAEHARTLAMRQLDSARQAWSAYQESGGIRTVQRLESTVSAEFRGLAKQLSDAYRALTESRRIFDELNTPPPPQWEALFAAVASEATQQRGALENLPVLDPDVRRQKLELLPEAASPKKNGG